MACLKKKHYVNKKHKFDSIGHHQLNLTDQKITFYTHFHMHRN